MQPNTPDPLVSEPFRAAWGRLPRRPGQPVYGRTACSRMPARPLHTDREDRPVPVHPDGIPEGYPPAAALFSSQPPPLLGPIPKPCSVGHSSAGGLGQAVKAHYRCQ